MIICESSKNPTFCSLANKSEFVYYETVYAISEIKRSYYDKGLFLSFSKNIERIKTLLHREQIQADEIEYSNVRLKIAKKVTNNPIRNPLFSFMFIVDSTGLNFNQLSSDIKAINKSFIPNMTIFLDAGILLNIEEEYKKRNIKINLYPEYSQNGKWVFWKWDDNPVALLAFQYMLLVQHLNISCTGMPDLWEYTQKTFNLSIDNLDEI